MTPSAHRSKPLIVVMGVSGSGKTTSGLAVAEALDVPFVDADALHPAANVRKMAAGVALDDIDREPWLRDVGMRMQEDSASGVVMACSALRKRYRDLILTQCPDAFFVHLDLPRPVLEERVRERADHFMPASLLDSQLATLERLQADEPGVEVHGDAPLAEIVRQVLEALDARPHPDV